MTGYQMSSRIDLVTAVTQIVSAFAVVITLALLIVSVRDNTAVLKATSAAESRDSLAAMNDWHLMLGEKHFALMLRASVPEARPEDFTDAERLYLTTVQRSFFRRAEAQYFRYRNGLLDEDAWQTVRQRVSYNLHSPIDLASWQTDRTQVYTAGFVESIESYKPSEREHTNE